VIFVEILNNSPKDVLFNMQITQLGKMWKKCCIVALTFDPKRRYFNTLCIAGWSVQQKAEPGHATDWEFGGWKGPMGRNCPSARNYV